MNVAIYARVSSLGNRQDTSRQVDDLKAEAVRRGLNVVHVFEEKASGAKSIDDRPALAECLDFCEDGGAQTILVSELSRLGRSVDDVLKNVWRCRDNFVNVIFQKEGFSIFLPDGRPSPFLEVFISVLATCAAIERENIMFRLNSGRRRYIENGGKLGRPAATVKTAEQYAAEYPKVVRELKKGTSIRRTAKLCDVGESTVQRIKKSLNL